MRPLLFIFAILSVVRCALDEFVLDSFHNCESLSISINNRLAVFPNATFFSVVPDCSGKYATTSLLYWLDYCNLNVFDKIVLFSSTFPGLSPLSPRSYESYVKHYSVHRKTPASVIYNLDDYLGLIGKTSAAVHISYFVGGVYGSVREHAYPRRVQDRISSLLNESTDRLQLERIRTISLSRSIQPISRKDKPRFHENFTSQYSLLTSRVVPIVSDMSIVADGSIFVYIFVCDIHLLLAQRYVHQLKSNCDLKETCPIVVLYNIHSVFCHSGSDGAVDDDVSNNKPSIYAALLELEDLLKDNNQDLDYVYLLVGLDALWSFPQPSKPDENSYIPSTVYAQVTLLSILSPIVLPTLSSNATAFAGLTMFMSRFVVDVKECLRYYQNEMEIDGYRICMKEMQVAMPKVVMFDEEVAVFRPNHSAVGVLPAESIDYLGQNTYDSNENNLALLGLYDISSDVVFLKESAVDAILQYAERHYAFNHAVISVDMIRSVTNAIQVEFFAHGEWFNAIYALWSFTQLLLSWEGCLDFHIDPIAREIALIALYGSNTNYITSLDEYSACHRLLLHMIQLLTPLSLSGSHHAFPAYRNNDPIFSKLAFAAYAAAVTISYDCRDVSSMKRLYSSSQQFLLTMHSPIFDRISEMQLMHDGLNASAVHFATYATNLTDGLRLLLKTAAISGVSVKILGMGKAFLHFGDRIKAYNAFLNSPHLVPTNVVAFIDAYDVLLFSSVRHISRMFNERIVKAPILVCADGGIYPDKMSSYFYPQGSYRSTNDFAYIPRYVNGGCLIGKVWALKEVFSFLSIHADSIGDDQLLLARHYQLFPSLYEIDHRQVLTMTTHKQYRFNILSSRLLSPLGIAMVVSPDMELILVNETNGVIEKNIGILHGNNMGSSPIYMLANLTYFSLFDMKYNRLEEAEYDAILKESNSDTNELSRRAKELRSRKLKEMWTRIDQKLILV